MLGVTGLLRWAVVWQHEGCARLSWRQGWRRVLLETAQQQRHLRQPWLLNEGICLGCIWSRRKPHT